MGRLKTLIEENAHLSASDLRILLNSFRTSHRARRLPTIAR